MNILTTLKCSHFAETLFREKEFYKLFCLNQTLLYNLEQNKEDNEQMTLRQMPMCST